MNKLWIAALLLFPAAAQKTLTFDAASVKPAPPPGAQGARGGGTPWREGMGRLHEPAASMRGLLIEAFGVPAFRISGPGWMDSERYAIDAMMPPTTTRDQLRVMMQNLLAERFQLAVHRETREQSVYSLAVGKNGPKLKEAAENTPPVEPKGNEPEFDADGFPNLALFPTSDGRVMSFVMRGHGRFIFRQSTIPALAEALMRQLNRTVLDDTGLTAHYDFVVDYSAEGMSGPNPDLPPPRGDPTQPDLFAALESQLGLKLESKKAPVETIVVDRVEKIPTGN